MGRQVMYESLNEALIDCVRAAGGSKVVGNKVWPEKTIDAAQRHLLNCLNEGKAERLTPEQTLLVARMARDHGCHAYASFVAHALSYAEPIPVEPHDEADELRRQVLEMGRSLQTALERLDQIDARSRTLRAAA
jgi:hypothetical protein